MEMTVAEMFSTQDEIGKLAVLMEGVRKFTCEGKVMVIYPPESMPSKSLTEKV